MRRDDTDLQIDRLSRPCLPADDFDEFAALGYVNHKPLPPILRQPSQGRRKSDNEASFSAAQAA